MKFNPDRINPPFYPVEAEIGDRQIVIPAVRIAVEGVEHVLTWGNTKIRTFDESDFDHVEFKDNEDVLKGIKAESDFINSLKRHHFPRLHLPYVDSDSYDWFISMAMRDIEEL